MGMVWYLVHEVAFGEVPHRAVFTPHKRPEILPTLSQRSEEGRMSVAWNTHTEQVVWGWGQVVGMAWLGYLEDAHALGGPVALAQGLVQTHPHPVPPCTPPGQIQKKQRNRCERDERERRGDKKRARTHL